MSKLGLALRGLGVAAIMVAGVATTAHAGEVDLQKKGTLVAPVLQGKGVQIYRCTEQADGTTAYTQLNVRATLKYGIAHSFVTPASGPPQWVAPDGSSVTATVVSRTDNGVGNIPELELAATQTGAEDGLLSKATTILRLNTVGGVAPAGPCTVGDVAEVPYQADYHFVSP